MAVPNSRLKTGHDRMEKDLKNIDNLSSSTCQISNLGNKNVEHLFMCPQLDKEFQKRGKINKLHLKARIYMNSL